MSNAYRIQDYAIRRNAFLEQYHEGHFVLWLVVSITISGIVLASLQLAAAYNLSVANGTALSEGGELSIEQGKISIRSAVSGLIILTLSFAFFLTYVIFVYPIQETKGVEMPPMSPIAVPGVANALFAGTPPSNGSPAPGGQPTYPAAMAPAGAPTSRFLASQGAPARPQSFPFSSKFSGPPAAQPGNR